MGQPPKKGHDQKTLSGPEALAIADTIVPAPPEKAAPVTVKLARERRRRRGAARVDETPPPASASPAEAPTEPPPAEIPAEIPADLPAVSERSPLADPKRWDRYEIVRFLGRGGMGSVYEARDRRLARHVAIKFIHGADPITTKRFLQEARAQARIDHPNVCKVLEVGEVEDKAYIAMQLVQGLSLHDAAKAMTFDERVRVMKTVTEAVHAAHRIGIIHRDIKPANIMVEKSENGDADPSYRPVLMDFGLAREASETKGLTESGTVMGTPGYMPPEQARGSVRSIDPRSDVYSLGATLYDILAGAPPFEDESAVNVLLKVLIQEPVPLRQRDPSIPLALDIIVGKCLNKEPHQRYPTAAELADDLERFLNRERVLARRLGLPTRLYWRAKRNKPMAFAVIALVSSLVAFAGYGVRTVIVNARNEAIAQKRAELGQKLGQAVKDLEWLVRSAYLVPLHDTGPEKAVVRARMAEIEAEMRSFGDLAAGLDHYALGRGYLALKEWDRAHAELTQAVSLGVREPELDYALGRVLGELYSRAIEEARRSGDKSYFEKRKQELDKEYLEPALTHLTRCRGLPTVPASYLEGLIHFYNRRYDEALQSARSARVGLSWLYEAEKLEGDVFMARALDAKDRGDNAPAERDFTEAVAHYEQAADIGRSDHQLYEALAEAWIRQEEMDLYSGRDPKPKLDKALSAADKALTAASIESDGHTKKAFAYNFQAQYGEGHGAARADVERLRRAQITAGEHAIALHPGDAHAHEITGLAYTKLAERSLDLGQPVQPLLDKAHAYLQEAIRLNPKFPWAYNDYGLALGYSAASKKRRNEDCQELLERAIDTTRKATQLDEGYVIGYNNTAVWLTDLAQWQADHGRDPEKAVQEAVQSAERAIQINQQNPLAYVNAGLATMNLASYRLDAGEDGRELGQKAIDRFKAALAIDPNFVYVQHELGRAYHLLASHERTRGQDPRPSLDAGLGTLTPCYRIEPENPDCKAVEALLRAAQGAWAPQEDAFSLSAFEQAQRLAREATQEVPERSELWLLLGQICLDWAEALLTSERPKVPPGPVVDEGLRGIEQALKLAPGLPRALAIEGALGLAKARVAPAQAKTSLERAKASLARAFAGNPLLEGRYGKAAAKVNRMVQGR
ncbi:serine/threonine-protein kinase [Polyangium jinanense]|uniref:non-specific serine/threonine protein kinase n=1 Tax=Polyangium jinanense TaxID=2829994 RepID=A0A9X4AR10_9BACT|nr:serine/threonine-protein kinase [Polyangium jinanense]MDC3955333.1 protein kinase [Polyangium jinanense]MDC3981634.1 protein kinase [Polyangium jinanense]